MHPSATCPPLVIMKGGTAASRNAQPLWNRRPLIQPTLGGFSSIQTRPNPLEQQASDTAHPWRVQQHPDTQDWDRTAAFGCTEDRAAPAADSRKPQHPQHTQHPTLSIPPNQHIPSPLTPQPPSTHPHTQAASERPTHDELIERVVARLGRRKEEARLQHRDGRAHRDRVKVLDAHLGHGVALRLECDLVDVAVFALQTRERAHACKLRRTSSVEGWSEEVTERGGGVGARGEGVGWRDVRKEGGEWLLC
eukprot:351769-Chlamydomonas_euryale.AAC.1